MKVLSFYEFPLQLAGGKYNFEEKFEELVDEGTAKLIHNYLLGPSKYAKRKI